MTSTKSQDFLKIKKEKIILGVTVGRSGLKWLRNFKI